MDQSSQPASKAPTCLQSLPPELILEICEWFCPHCHEPGPPQELSVRQCNEQPARRALVNLCLTSRWLRNIVQPLMYHYPRIVGTDDGSDFGMWPAQFSFSESAVGANQENAVERLLNLVRTLNTVPHLGRAMVQLDGSFIVSEASPNIELLLMAAPNLRAAEFQLAPSTIADMRVNQRWPAVPPCLPGAASLRELMLSRPGVNSADRGKMHLVMPLLQKGYLVNLHTLTLNCCDGVIGTLPSDLTWVTAEPTVVLQPALAQDLGLDAELEAESLPELGPAAGPVQPMLADGLAMAALSLDSPLPPPLPLQNLTVLHLFQSEVNFLSFQNLLSVVGPGLTEVVIEHTSQHDNVPGMPADDNEFAHQLLTADNALLALLPWRRRLRKFVFSIYDKDPLYFVPEPMHNLASFTALRELSLGVSSFNISSMPCALADALPPYVRVLRVNGNRNLVPALDHLRLAIEDGSYRSLRRLIVGNKQHETSQYFGPAMRYLMEEFLSLGIDTTYVNTCAEARALLPDVPGRQCPCKLTAKPKCHQLDSDAAPRRIGAELNGPFPHA